MLQLLESQIIGSLTANLSWYHFRYACRGKVLGAENLPSPPYIVAANHVSYLDWMVLFALFRKVVRQDIIFVAKHTLLESRYFRDLMRYSHAVIVEQGKTSKEAFRRIKDVIASGKVLGIFPEGTRTADGRLSRGFSGVGRMALLYDVPVVPVGLNGFFEMLPRHRVVPRIAKCNINIGAPLQFAKRRASGAIASDAAEVTRRVMIEIGRLTGQEYPYRESSWSDRAVG